MEKDHGVLFKVSDLDVTLLSTKYREEFWKGVSKIGQYAFAGLNLEEIEIPSQITEIGDYAFEGCKNLKRISIPNCVVNLSSQAFVGCKLKYAYLLDNGTVLTTEKDKKLEKTAETKILIKSEKERVKNATTEKERMKENLENLVL